MPASHATPVILRARAARVLGAALCLVVATAHAEENEESKVIEAGSTVGLEYTLTLQDGTQVESNVGEDALSFEQGSGQIIPGLDSEVIGMKVGDTKKVTVPAEQGYGPVDPAAFSEVPTSELPEDAREAGAMLFARDDQGNTQRLRVHEVEGETATLDFNHPLAGQTLVFDIKILAVQ